MDIKNMFYSLILLTIFFLKAVLPFGVLLGFLPEVENPLGGKKISLPKTQTNGCFAPHDFGSSSGMFF